MGRQKGRSPSALPDTVSVVNASGTAFFQRIGGIYARLEQGHALKVMEVF